MTDLEQTRQRILSQSRIIAVSRAVAILIAASLTELFDVGERLMVLVAPAALFGLVAPVLGFRLYLWQRERTPRQADPVARCHAFARATLLAQSATEAAAYFGVVSFLLSGRSFALVGVLTHILLTGALWPTDERLDAFVDFADGAPR